METVLIVLLISIVLVPFGYLFLLLLYDASPKTVTKILSFITFRKMVWLKHFDGKVTLSLICEDGYGKYCYIYPFTKVGYVRLHKDGTASSYIDEWKPYQDSQ